MRCKRASFDASPDAGKSPRRLGMRQCSVRRLLTGAVLLFIAAWLGRTVTGNFFPRKAWDDACQASVLVFVLRFGVSRRAATTPTEVLLSTFLGSSVGAVGVLFRSRTALLVLIGVAMLLIHHPCPTKTRSSMDYAAPSLGFWQLLLAAYWFVSRPGADVTLASCLSSVFCHSALLIASAELVVLLSVPSAPGEDDSTCPFADSPLGAFGAGGSCAEGGSPVGCPADGVLLGRPESYGSNRRRGGGHTGATSPQLRQGGSVGRAWSAGTPLGASGRRSSLPTFLEAVGESQAPSAPGPPLLSIPSCPEPVSAYTPAPTLVRSSSAAAHIGSAAAQMQGLRRPTTAPAPPRGGWTVAAGAAAAATAATGGSTDRQRHGRSYAGHAVPEVTSPYRRDSEPRWRRHSLEHSVPAFGEEPGGSFGLRAGVVLESPEEDADCAGAVADSCGVVRGDEDERLEALARGKEGIAQQLASSMGWAGSRGDTGADPRVGQTGTWSGAWGSRAATMQLQQQGGPHNEPCEEQRQQQKQQQRQQRREQHLLYRRLTGSSAHDYILLASTIPGADGGCGYGDSEFETESDDDGDGMYGEDEDDEGEEAEGEYDCFSLVMENGNNGHVNGNGGAVLLAAGAAAGAATAPGMPTRQQRRRSGGGRDGGDMAAPVLCDPGGGHTDEDTQIHLDPMRVTNRARTNALCDDDDGEDVGPQGSTWATMQSAPQSGGGATITTVGVPGGSPVVATRATAGAGASKRESTDSCVAGAAPVRRHSPYCRPALSVAAAAAAPAAAGGNRCDAASCEDLMSLEEVEAVAAPAPTPTPDGFASPKQRPSHPNAIQRGTHHGGGSPSADVDHRPADADAAAAADSAGGLAALGWSWASGAITATSGTQFERQQLVSASVDRVSPRALAAINAWRSDPLQAPRAEPPPPPASRAPPSPSPRLPQEAQQTGGAAHGLADPGRPACVAQQPPQGPQGQPRGVAGVGGGGGGGVGVRGPGPYAAWDPVATWGAAASAVALTAAAEAGGVEASETAAAAAVEEVDDGGSGCCVVSLKEENLARHTAATSARDPDQMRLPPPDGPDGHGHDGGAYDGGGGGGLIMVHMPPLELLERFLQHAVAVASAMVQHGDLPYEDPYGVWDSGAEEDGGLAEYAAEAAATVPSMLAGLHRDGRGTAAAAGGGSDDEDDDGDSDDHGVGLYGRPCPSGRPGRLQDRNHRKACGRKQLHQHSPRHGEHQPLSLRKHRPPPLQAQNQEQQEEQAGQEQEQAPVRSPGQRRLRARKLSAGQLLARAVYGSLDQYHPYQANRPLYGACGQPLPYSDADPHGAEHQLHKQQQRPRRHHHHHHHRHQHGQVLSLPPRQLDAATSYPSPHPPDSPKQPPSPLPHPESANPQHHPSHHHHLNLGPEGPLPPQQQHHHHQQQYHHHQQQQQHYHQRRSNDSRSARVDPEGAAAAAAAAAAADVDFGSPWPAPQTGAAVSGVGAVAPLEGYEVRIRTAQEWLTPPQQQQQQQGLPPQGPGRASPTSPAMAAAVAAANTACDIGARRWSSSTAAAAATATSAMHSETRRDSYASPALEQLTHQPMRHSIDIDSMSRAPTPAACGSNRQFSYRTVDSCGGGGSPLALKSTAGQLVDHPDTMVAAALASNGCAGVGLSSGGSGICHTASHQPGAGQGQWGAEADEETFGLDDCGSGGCSPQQRHAQLQQPGVFAARRMPRGKGLAEDEGPSGREEEDTFALEDCGGVAAFPRLHHNHNGGQGLLQQPYPYSYLRQLDSVNEQQQQQQGLAGAEGVGLDNEEEEEEEDTFGLEDCGTGSPQRLQIQIRLEQQQHQRQRRQQQQELQQQQQQQEQEEETFELDNPQAAGGVLGSMTLGGAAGVATDAQAAAAAMWLPYGKPGREAHAETYNFADGVVDGADGLKAEDCSTGGGLQGPSAAGAQCYAGSRATSAAGVGPPLQPSPSPTAAPCTAPSPPHPTPTLIQPFTAVDHVSYKSLSSLHLQPSYEAQLRLRTGSVDAGSPAAAVAAAAVVLGSGRMYGSGVRLTGGGAATTAASQVASPSKPPMPPPSPSRPAEDPVLDPANRTPHALDEVNGCISNQLPPGASEPNAASHTQGHPPQQQQQQHGMSAATPPAPRPSGPAGEGGDEAQASTWAEAAVEVKPEADAGPDAGLRREEGECAV